MARTAERSEEERGMEDWPASWLPLAAALSARTASHAWMTRTAAGTWRWVTSSREERSREAAKEASSGQGVARLMREWKRERDEME